MEPQAVIDTSEELMLPGVTGVLIEMEGFGRWAEQAAQGVNDMASEKTLLAQAGTSAGQMVGGWLAGHALKLTGDRVSALRETG